MFSKLNTSKKSDKKSPSGSPKGMPSIILRSR